MVLRDDRPQQGVAWLRSCQSVDIFSVTAYAAGVVDKRTERRAQKNEKAAHVAALLDDARVQLASHALGEPFTDAQRVVRLVARAKPDPFFALSPTGGFIKGWERRTITARRTYGEQVTAYYHAKSRTFRTKAYSCAPAREQRPLMLDLIHEVSGLVASCTSCGRIYAKSDQRMRFCSTTCAARERQRLHRRNTPEKLEAARVAYAAFEAAKVQRIPSGPISEYAAEERAVTADLHARKQQQRDRTKKGGRKDWRA